MAARQISAQSAGKVGRINQPNNRLLGIELTAHSDNHIKNSSGRYLVNKDNAV